jgi:hypothetical protein
VNKQIEKFILPENKEIEYFKDAIKKIIEFIKIFLELVN